MITLGDVEDAEVVTIEGLDPAGEHPVQRACRELSVPQCGFCQAGQIMHAAALLVGQVRAERRAVPAVRSHESHACDRS